MMNFALLRPAMVKMMAGAVICGLAGCGGGGGSDTPVTEEPRDEIPVVPETSTSGQRASATALLTEWAPTNPPVYTALSAIPQTGGADYTGFIYGELANDSDSITDSVIGSLTLEVGFTAAGATFTGTASDFVDEDDADLTGSLTVSGGTLNRDGNPASDATVGANLAGTLTDTADRELAFGVQLEGDFLGSAYNAIGGAALGRVTVGSVNQDFDGGFIAER